MTRPRKASMATMRFAREELAEPGEETDEV
ncbi:hypothetical protein L284_01650 [Novosphingobium lindaniclasticum LE124]|uniref:Uncharacterized protein n=1 Tax=Novosphingobium lindaniclasticum LE124 TaxID=1096930 RepID=T0HSX1_9SPHN|nr:hypothetical protein L284_01650 [Novosphingobium lindaniclasticum LE124]